ncbi:MAG: response regulator transcription factor [Gaiellaceae bacterium]
MIEPSVLVVEDDHRLRSLILRGLREAGFRAEGVVQASELLERLPHVNPDVLVIDVGLPDADGRDLCRSLRAQGFTAPIMFLTARDAVPDRLTGFAAGGDDYLTKPFNFAELVARLQALVRRGGTEQVAEVGGLRLDPARHGITCGSESVELTPTEFRIFARMAARPGDAVRRRELVQAAWPDGAIVHENTLDVYIASIRRKLATLPEAPAIKTIYGVGYSIR